MVSVKQLFLLLLAAVVLLLALFFLHGPFLEEGVDQAVHDALMALAEPGGGEVRAEGHRLFQCARKGETLEAAGVYSQAYADGCEITVTDPVAFRMVLTGPGDGSWTATGFERAPNEAARQEMFPLTLRVLMGDPAKYAGELREQINRQIAGER